MKGRIWFANNPWPKGHALTHATWSGRLDPSGRLVFDLDLQSASYDADDRRTSDANVDDEDEENKAAAEKKAKAEPKEKAEPKPKAAAKPKAKAKPKPKADE